MEFVSNVDDLFKLTEQVGLLPNGKGIQMELFGQSAVGDFSRIVYGETKKGKRFIETVSMVNHTWPVYDEASIPDIIAFAKKAKIDLSDSKYTKELLIIAQKLETL